MNFLSKTILSIALIALTHTAMLACTNVLITKGASKTGSVMVTYSADSYQLYGELYRSPAATHPKGSKIKIHEWDTGKYLGEIAQIEKTYSTIGNMNEHQLIIVESTFGGRSELVDTTGIMDYGSLIYITLQRAKTAKEAIKVMTELVEEYGYYSSGESISIADKNEVWLMEMIGKGTKLNRKGENINKGANWVAIRIPDGYVSAHANQSRITTFPLNDPDNCLYSKDMIKFAREAGYFTGKDYEFSFSDAFAPTDFGAMRYCEARVWSAFNKMGGGMIGDSTSNAYLDYAMGTNPNNKMPLYIKPSEKMDVRDVANVMRDYYKGTPLDPTTDLGAGAYETPFRWGKLSYTVDSVQYVHERPIATQQTGFWLVGEARSWLPDEIGGILWFGVDNAATSALTPIFSSSLRAPVNFKVGNGNMSTYSPTSAFWLFNRVSNNVYPKFSLMIPEVNAAAAEHELGALKILPDIDREALELSKTHPNEVKEFLTQWSERFSERLFKKWQELDQLLLVKYNDGGVKQQNPDGSFKDNGNKRNIIASPIRNGYSDDWNRRVVKDAGEKYKAVK